MALDYIIASLQLSSAAVNVLALGAFWISPGLRATANRFVINLLCANIIAVLCLTPGLFLHGGLKTRFHMTNNLAEKDTDHIYQSTNLDLQAEYPKSLDDKLDSFETSTFKTLHHNKHHHHHHSHNGKVERDVEQPDYIDSDQYALNRKNIKESIESVIIGKDEHGNLLEVREKEVVDIQHGNKKAQIEIVEEMVGDNIPISERQIHFESIGATFKQKGSTAHRTSHTVFSENSLIFDCTRFWGFDFAAAVGKHTKFIFM